MPAAARLRSSVTEPRRAGGIHIRSFRKPSAPAHCLPWLPALPQLGKTRAQAQGVIGKRFLNRAAAANTWNSWQTLWRTLGRAGLHSLSSATSSDEKKAGNGSLWLLVPLTSPLLKWGLHFSHVSPVSMHAWLLPGPPAPGRRATETACCGGRVSERPGQAHPDRSPRRQLLPVPLSPGAPQRWRGGRQAPEFCRSLRDAVRGRAPRKSPRCVYPVPARPGKRGPQGNTCRVCAATRS